MAPRAETAFGCSAASRFSLIFLTPLVSRIMNLPELAGLHACLSARRNPAHCEHVDTSRSTSDPRTINTSSRVTVYNADGESGLSYAPAGLSPFLVHASPLGRERRHGRVKLLHVHSYTGSFRFTTAYSHTPLKCFVLGPEPTTCLYAPVIHYEPSRYTRI